MMQAHEITTPGFAIPGWIVYALAAAFFAAVPFIIYFFWWKARIPWKELPGYYAGTKYVAPADVDPKLIVAALQASEGFLIAKTKWSAANLALVGHHVYVFVANMESWTDIYGRKIAGTQVGHILQVGKSLSALCHEMAHLCELVLDNEVDDEHKTWDVDGITAAITEYQKWLQHQADVDRVASLVSGVQSIAPKIASGMATCSLKGSA